MHNVAKFDLFFEENTKLLELSFTACDCVGASRQNCLQQFGGLVEEVLATGDEVGLALQLDHRSGRAFNTEGNQTLVVFSVVALCACRQPLLSQVLLGSLDITR